jgi:hypothetical protein
MMRLWARGAPGCAHTRPFWPATRMIAVVWGMKALLASSCTPTWSVIGAAPRDCYGWRDAVMIGRSEGVGLGVRVSQESEHFG